MSAPPRSLPVVALRAGSGLWRVHRAARPAEWFGPAPGEPPSNRFDAPRGEYRICYFGDSPEVSFAETLIRQPRSRLIQRRQLEERCVSRIPLRRDLRLACFHGPGLVRLEVGADVAHGQPYDRCQEIGAMLWAHRDLLDGIEYRSRWDNDRLCVALFDRAADALDVPDRVHPLTEPAILDPILRLYDVGVI